VSTIDILVARATEDDNTTKAGRSGEMVFLVDSHKMAVHDGSRKGGYTLARDPYSSVAALVAGDEGARGAGQIWDADKFKFIELAPEDPDYDVMNQDGVRFAIADRRIIDVRAFNPPTDNETDATAALQAALDAFKAEISGDAPVAEQTVLRIVGRYMVSSQLRLHFDEVQVGRGVIDMSYGQITAADDFADVSIMRVTSEVTTRNLAFRFPNIRKGTSNAKVMLEMDGGDVSADTSYEFGGGSLARWVIENPCLTGGLVPLWIRNNCFEGVINNPNITVSDSADGYRGILLEDSTDAVEPGAVNNGTCTGKVSSISTFGGTIKGGENCMRVSGPIDARTFGVTMLNSGKEMYHALQCISGILFGCHLENAWDNYAGAETKRPVVRMDSRILIDGCDYRQSTGDANVLVRHYVSAGVRSKLGSNLITSAGVDQLYLANPEDNGGRVIVPDVARGKIIYHDSHLQDGPKMVAVEALTTWNSLGDQDGSSSIQIDLTDGNSYFMTATGNLTFAQPTGGHPGDYLTIIVKQDATGGRTISWNNRFRPGRTIDATADLITSWHFVFSGSSWTDIGGAAGVVAT